MSTKHTPGPWRVKLGTYPMQDLADTQIPEGTIMDIVGAKERSALSGHYPYRATDEDKANAARIVACVNACEGLADPSVIPLLIKELEKLVARCDGPEGVQPDGSNMGTISAHAVLAKVR